MDNVPTEREVCELRYMYQAALARTHEYSVANLHAETTISSLRARAEAAERLNGELVEALRDISSGAWTSDGGWEFATAAEFRAGDIAREALVRIESAST